MVKSLQHSPFRTFIYIKMSNESAMYKNVRPVHFTTNAINQGSVSNIRMNNLENKNSGEAEYRRQQSILKKIKSYNQQQAAIKKSLSHVDFKNAVVFNEEVELKNNQCIVEEKLNKCKEKKILFCGEDENNFSFKINRHFEGKNGQKIFALQSRYKNDFRFNLDDRFLQDIEETNEQDEQNVEMNKHEKIEELKCLQHVLGNEFEATNMKLKNTLLSKKMLRFDPTQNDHIKYELVNHEKGHEHDKIPNLRKNEIDLTYQPQVSKISYFKLDDNFKQTFQDNRNFSLMNIFERPIQSNEGCDKVQNAEIEANKNIPPEISFFEDGILDGIKTANFIDESNNKNCADILNLRIERFFYKDDDFRLQEGLDFLKRISSAEKVYFSTLRQKLKYIMKLKSRNSRRKDKPFRKKIGQNKKLKHIRIKKII